MPPPPVRLSRGEAEGDTVVGLSGVVATRRASSEIAGIAVSDDTVTLAWRDGATILLDRGATIRFADGDLSLDPTTAGFRAVRLWETVTGGHPDAATAAALTGLFEAGHATGTVAGWLMSGPAWDASVAGLSPVDTANLLWVRATGALADPATSAWIVNCLAGGMPLPHLIAYMLSSPAALQRAVDAHPSGAWTPDATRVAVLRSYDAVLDMVPDPAGLAHAAWLLDSGYWALPDLYASLMATDLAYARHAGQDNATFTIAAYTMALERAPTAAEATLTRGALDRGDVSRLDVMLALGTRADGTGRGPFDPGPAQGTFYPSDAEGETALARGTSSDRAAHGRDGTVLLTRSVSDLAALQAGDTDLILTWDDATSLRLSGVRALRFADGRLDLEGEAPIAVAARLHSTIIGTEPTAAWLELATPYLEAGVSMRAIAASMVDLAGPGGPLAGLSAAALARAINLSLLGAAPPAETTALAARIGSEGLASAIVPVAESAAAAARYETTHRNGTWTPDHAGNLVVRAYDAVLDSTPDPGALRLWTDAIARTGDGMLPYLYEWLASTSTYRAAHVGTTDAEWLASIHRQALERDATPAEMARGFASLAAGESRFDVVQDIAALAPEPHPPPITYDLIVF